MARIIHISILFTLVFCEVAFTQSHNISPKNFFTDQDILEIQLVSDFKNLIKQKRNEGYKEQFQQAKIICLFPDGHLVEEEIEIRPRGEFRREECYMPPLMLNFKLARSENFQKLGKLKLVLPCKFDPYHEQLILKEFLIYKIYNLLTEKSFRVRLVKIKYQDINTKMHADAVFAFFIEDVDDMAKRNGCTEMELAAYHTESTDRNQTTLVSLFQFMIGNTDWAVPLYRNIKLIVEGSSSTVAPYVVPYDFDYCGLVNPDYGIPPPGLSITSLQERLYRGYPRSILELNAVLDIFKKNKNSIDSIIDNTAYLYQNNRKEMKRYLDEFFDIIKSEKEIKYTFITNARTK